jgi:hypothetical protein
VDPQAAFLAFAACMREHGVDMPDPQFQTGPNGGGSLSVTVNGDPNTGGDDPVKKADEACRHLIQGVTLGQGNGPGMDPATQEALLKFSACMRDHGIDMPDPQFDGNGGAMLRLGGPDGAAGPAFDPTSSEFKTAEDACRHLMPGGGKDGGFSVSGPSSGSGGAGSGPITQSKP